MHLLPRGKAKLVSSANGPHKAKGRKVLIAHLSRPFLAPNQDNKNSLVE
jgi:hypothetical protein